MRLAGEELRRAIRLRPVMYIGDASVFGKTRLVESLLLLGAMAARETRLGEVSVLLTADGSCSVAFDGWPWPISAGVSPFDALEPWLGFMHFDVGAQPPPGMPRGVVFDSSSVELGLLNALSSPLEVVAWYGGQSWRRTFREGLPAESPQHTAPEMAPPSSGVGLRFTFTPDASVFYPPPGFSAALLTERLSSLSALIPASTWRLRDEASGMEVSFRREHGLANLCVERSANSCPLHAPWTFNGSAGQTQVSLALQWGRAPVGAGILSWANHESCRRGGTHHDGLYRGLRTALRARMKARRRSLASRAFTDEALSEHLTAVMSLGLPSTVWYGPTRGELANPEVRGEVSKLVADWMKQALASHPKVESELFTLLGASLS
ncbi:DNA gyrase subunit B [Myxococcus stipitatus]|uniref:DNA gyrase subunit B n=1 Tax=Myxococcus stipitatus TaxID=83455 RepID=UPI0030D04D7F